MPSQVHKVSYMVLFSLQKVQEAKKKLFKFINGTTIKQSQISGQHEKKNDSLKHQHIKQI